MAIRPMQMNNLYEPHGEVLTRLWFLLPLRLYVGVYFVILSIQKVAAGYFSNPAVLTDFLRRTIEAPDYPHAFYRAFFYSAIMPYPWRGYGAFKIGLSLPHKYAAAASMSGAVDICAILGGHDESWRKEMETIFGDCGKVARSDNDLFHLAGKLVQSKEPRPLLYQCCGTSDFLYQDNLRFREHAKKIGLEVTYTEGPADHEWGYWDREIQKIIEWLPLRK